MAQPCSPLSRAVAVNGPTRLAPMPSHPDPIARAVAEEVRELVHELLPEIESRRYDITWKPDGSPVTAADVLVEKEVAALLRARLGALRFIGEETGDSAPDQSGGWQVVLDPIDGTENFCSGLKEWGVSLSIWRGDDHAASMLYLPELDESMISGDSVTPRHSRILGLSSSLSEEIVEALRGAGEARIIGCAVYNMFNVIRGGYRRFLNPVGARSWDLQAGVMLALEHGLDVRLNGEPYAGGFLLPDRKYRVDITHRAQ